MTSKNNLPFLPGYNSTMPSGNRHHKTQMFEVRNGVHGEIDREVAQARQIGLATNPINPFNVSLSDTFQPKGDFSDLKAKPYRTVKKCLAEPPSVIEPWLAYDRKVLRFYAYFKEAVHASPLETERVRRCVIYYYLADGSMHIGEPKVENSGITQPGVFVKRHRVPNPQGTAILGVQDFDIGVELPIYGRVFVITDADEFTKAFYEENGRPLSAPLSSPSDAFQARKAEKPKHFNKTMHPHKLFMEAALGKFIGASIESTQKFLKNDGKVLRFYCIWDDDKMLGEKRPYVLHYFLADDTVEILEVRQQNSGRDPFPTLVRRAKMPKSTKDINLDMSRIGYTSDDSSIEYYTAKDFRVGDVIMVFSRPLLLCGVDAFTQNYYAKNFGLREEDFPRLIVDEEKAAPLQMSPPPYAGFGSEEDSLGSFLFLNPKVPRTDFKKFMENDGMHMRFLTEFVDAAPNDRNRKFIMTFYLNNDTLGLFERFDRNSGFVGGKFLERSRFKNPETGEYFKATDFRVGKEITVNKYRFRILEADEYTAKFMANNPELFAEFDMQATAGRR